MNTEKTKLEQKIKDLKAGQKDDVSTDELNKATEALKGIEQELGKTTEKLTKVGKQIKDLEERKKVANQLLKDLTDELAEVGKDIKTLEGTLAENEKKINDGTNKVKKLASEIKGLEEDIKSIEDKLQKLLNDQHEAQTLHAQYLKLVEDLKNAKKELALLKEELKSTQENLTAASADAKAKYDKYTAILKQYELEKLTYGTPKDAPTVEKPEFDISKLAKPSNPGDSNKPTSPTLRDKNKEIERNQKQGAVLPKTGENTKSSVFVGLIMLITSIILKRRIVK